MGNYFIKEKVCTKCKELKATKEFGASKKAKDNLNSWCKECMKRHMQLKRAGLIKTRVLERDLVPVEPGYKWCSDCKTVKALEEFGNYKSSGDGKRSQCKVCNCNGVKRYVEENYKEVYERKAERRKDPEVYTKEREYDKQRYWNNREEDLERQRAYRNRTLGQQRQRYQNYHANNKDKERIYRASYRLRNKDRMDLQRRLHRQQKPHLAIACVNRRRAIKRQALAAWGNKSSILAFYEHAALMTKLTGVKHEVDHIIPLSNGLVCGLHVEANLRVVTKETNLRKSNSFNIHHHHYSLH